MCVQCMYRGPILKSPAKRGPGSGVYVYEKLYFGLGGGGGVLEYAGSGYIGYGMCDSGAEGG